MPPPLRLAGRHTYAPSSHLSLMAKDLAYAGDEGKRHAIDLWTAAAALKVFKQAITTGNGDSDLSAVVEQFRTR